MSTPPDFPSYKPEDRKDRGLNFNTLVGIIALAAITWVGNKTTTTAETVTEIKTTMPYITQSVGDLKAQIGQLVTRSELDAKASDLNARMEILNTRLLKLEYEKIKPEP